MHEYIIVGMGVLWTCILYLKYRYVRSSSGDNLFPPFPPRGSRTNRLEKGEEGEEQRFLSLPHNSSFI